MNKRFSDQVFTILLSSFFITLGTTVAITMLFYSLLSATLLISLLSGLFTGVVMAIALAMSIQKKVSSPLIGLHEQIHHITSPDPIQNYTQIEMGQEVVTEALTSIGNYIQAVSQQSAQANPDASVLLDRISYPILGINNSSTIVYANNAAEELLKTPMQSIVGQPLATVLTLKSTQGNVPLFDWLLEQRGSKIESEHVWASQHYTQGNHTTYDFDIWARYVRNAGDGIETLFLLMDRTLEREHEDLKVDLVAMAAHDLRAPITVIRGLLEAIDDELQQYMNEEQKEMMHRLTVSSAQLSGFINNILSSSQVDAGVLKVHTEKHNWSTFLSELMEQLQHTAAAHGKQVTLQVQEPLPEVSIDRNSITQVINNLVGNAIKYSGPQNKSIEINVMVTPNGDVATTVVDHGVGIPDALVGKLFTKYYRSHRTKKEFGGTGLGLYITKAIVEAHGGQVWAQSKEGEGSTFGFSLPPYDKVASSDVNEDNSRTMKGTHGWIKNHSLYRR